MDPSKLAGAAGLVSLAACVWLTACGGRVGDDLDGRATIAEGAAPRADAAAPKPARLACPSAMSEGAACGATDWTCTDESSCTETVYRCLGGAWQVVSASSCARQTEKPCPDAEPSDNAWCARPGARCSYVDGCSQRPATVPSARDYECVGERGARWTLVSPSYAIACPAAAPANGSACEPGCRLPALCTFATACGALSATCEPRSATWHVTGPSCPGDAGAGD